MRARGLAGLEGGQHFFGEERHALRCPFSRHHSVAHLADQLAEARGLLGTEQCLEHFFRRAEGADIERGGTDGFDGCFEFGARFPFEKCSKGRLIEQAVVPDARAVGYLNPVASLLKPVSRRFCQEDSDKKVTILQRLFCAPESLQFPSPSFLQSLQYSKASSFRIRTTRQARSWV